MDRRVVVLGRGEGGVDGTSAREVNGDGVGGETMSVSVEVFLSARR